VIKNHKWKAGELKERHGKNTTTKKVNTNTVTNGGWTMLPKREKKKTQNKSKGWDGEGCNGKQNKKWRGKISKEKSTKNEMLPFDLGGGVGDGRRKAGRGEPRKRESWKKAHLRGNLFTGGVKRSFKKEKKRKRLILGIRVPYRHKREEETKRQKNSDKPKGAFRPKRQKEKEVGKGGSQAKGRTRRTGKR